MQIRIAQITDAHIFEDPHTRFEGCDTRASIEAVLAEIQSLGNIDLIVATGDMSMDGGFVSYRFLNSLFSGCDIPVLAVPGNHDKPGVASQASNFYFFTSTVKRDFGSWRFHFLNTKKDGHELGEIDSKDLAELSENIVSAGSKPQIIFMHHPPLNVGSAWLDDMKLENSSDFWQIVSQSSNIKGVFCGHVHQDNELSRNGMPVITTPSTCVQFKRHSRVYQIERLQPGFRIIEALDDETCSHHLVRLEPSDDFSVPLL
jgi:Icc protein|tara:strand:- start:1615 stop:2391 length:777 start_codon:yes stop_codon:yes gene_type:complete